MTETNSKRGLGAGKRLIITFFTISGAAGLIYQVVWTRELVLVFGNTTEAIVTTVASFLAGLGIGALAGGALAARLRRPLRAYGLLEVAVGLIAVVIPSLFGGVASLFGHAYQSFTPSEVFALRFALSFIVLLPVTAAMGATLPVLTRYFVRLENQIGVRIATLYGVNTLGAVMGTLSSGLVLIELFGLRGVTNIAVALNCGIGLIALRKSRLEPVAEAVGKKSGVAIRKSKAQALLLGATTLSGFTSLSLEVLWTRLIMQGTGGYIYFFVGVLAVFLLGIGIGSLLFESRGDSHVSPGTLAMCLGAVGALSLVPAAAADGLGPTHFAIALLAMLPVTILMGYAFPLTARLFINDADYAGQGIAAVYGCNTAGAVIGVIFTGFALIPWIGANRSIALVGVVQLLAACVFVLVTRTATTRRQMWAAIVLPFGLIAASFLPVVSRTSTQLRLESLGLLASHTEDTIATVDAEGGTPRQRQLYVGGNGMTGLTIDTKLISYIPKALRPEASNILLIAFGMGSSYRSALNLKLHTDAVELSPDVPDAMPAFYSDAHEDLRDPLGHIIIDDGRNYVRYSNKTYDLIALDAPPPSEAAGTAVLLTQEFYQEVKARLTPDGVFGTFLTVDMSTCDLRSHLKTFRSVFPHTMIFNPPGQNGIYVLGSDSPLTFQPAIVEKVFGSVSARRDLTGAPDFRPLSGSQWLGEINKDIYMRDAQIDRLVGNVPLITDDHPYSEYYLVRQFLGQHC